MILTLLFGWASTFVESVGWLFSQFIHLIVKGISLFFTWGITRVQNMPENIQIPISAMLAIFFLGILMAGLWAFPHIILITFIVIPLILFLLKIFVGWLTLIGLIYVVYLFVKHSSLHLINHIRSEKTV